MAFFIDAREILDEFQMTNPVIVLATNEQSYDPVLPKNKSSLSSPTLNEFIQDAGGFDDVNRAVWYTTVKVKTGDFVLFNNIRWRIVSTDDYNATTFSNFYVYGLLAAESLQGKDVSEDGEYWK